jgi:hypothetical protein
VPYIYRDIQTRNPGNQKLQATSPPNTDDLRQQMWECMQRNPMEMFHAMKDFPSRLQECTEQHRGHLQSVTFKQKGLR